MAKVFNYKLNSSKDVLNMEYELRNEEYPNVFVAVELAQNIIDHASKGQIKINGESITAISDKCIDVACKIEEAKKFERGTYEGGMGYKMILAAGWNIETETKRNKLIITAKKHD